MAICPSMPSCEEARIAVPGCGRGHDLRAFAARGHRVVGFDLVSEAVAEARALGADCILIIMACVSDAQALELEAAATEQGMDVLVAVHDEAELERAASLASPLLGVNNRDLNTFETTLDTTRRLARLADSARLLISESGLATPKDLADMAQYGARCFLIGETLMRQDDVEAATRAILSRPQFVHANHA